MNSALLQAHNATLHNFDMSVLNSTGMLPIHNQLYHLQRAVKHNLLAQTFSGTLKTNTGHRKATLSVPVEFLHEQVDKVMLDATAILQDNVGESVAESKKKQANRNSRVIQKHEKVSQGQKLTNSVESGMRMRAKVAETKSEASKNAKSSCAPRPKEVIEKRQQPFRKNKSGKNYRVDLSIVSKSEKPLIAKSGKKMEAELPSKAAQKPEKVRESWQHELGVVMPITKSKQWRSSRKRKESTPIHSAEHETDMKQSVLKTRQENAASAKPNLGESRPVQRLSETKVPPDSGQNSKKCAKPGKEKRETSGPWRSLKKEVSRQSNTGKGKRQTFQRGHKFSVVKTH